MGLIWRTSCFCCCKQGSVYYIKETCNGGTSSLCDTLCRYCQVRPLWTRMESRQRSASMLEGTSQLSLRLWQCSYHSSSLICRRPVDIDAGYDRAECIITTHPTSDTILQLGNRVAADLRNNRIILMDIVVSGSPSPHCILGMWYPLPHPLSLQLLDFAAPSRLCLLRVSISGLR